LSAGPIPVFAKFPFLPSELRPGDFGCFLLLTIRFLFSYLQFMHSIWSERSCKLESRVWLDGESRSCSDHRALAFKGFLQAASGGPHNCKPLVINAFVRVPNWYRIFTLTLRHYVCVLVFNEAPTTIFEATARRQANRRSSHCISAGDASGSPHRNMQDQARDQSNNCAIRYGSAFCAAKQRSTGTPIRPDKSGMTWSQ
jgi:hypothetical protein